MNRLAFTIILTLAFSLLSVSAGAVAGETCTTNANRDQCISCCDTVDGVRAGTTDAQRLDFFVDQLDVVIPARIADYTTQRTQLQALSTRDSTQAARLDFFVDQLDVVLSARRTDYIKQRTTLDVPYCKSKCPVAVTTTPFTVAVVQPSVQGTTLASPATGKITSVPGIDCGSDCSENYATSVTSVVLTAELVTPATLGAVFSGWSEAACGTAATCTVALPTSQKVSATFTCTPLTYRGFTEDRTGVCDLKAGCKWAQQCQSVNGVNTWVEVTSS